MTLYLSCGNCKTVRSFSGALPTCDVCGWVCTTANMRAIVAPPRTTKDMPNGRNSSNGVSVFLSLSFGALCLAGFCYWFFPATWYATWYNTDTDQVHIEAEPHDCDFFKAPLGEKECHFVKQVETQTDSKTGKVSVYVYWNRVEGN